jgi:DNA-binding CsgD family transcriptional regulator
MDAAGSRRAVLLGYSEGGPISIRTAATAPDRVVGLILYGTSARRPPPWAVAQLRRVVDRWGEGHSTDLFAPGLGPDGRRTLGTLERMAASPAMARAVVDALARVNVIGLLPEVRVPTLVVHRRGDFVPIRDARYTARRISGARLVELEGEQHMPWLGDWRSVVDAVGGFLSELGGAAPRPGRRSAGEPTQPGWAGLTAAEVAVVEVVAEGLSNPEAAARLFLSRKTVETHLKHVYSKLGIRSRAELAALYAARRSAEIT